MALDVAALYEREWKPIYGFLSRRMPAADPAEVEDLTARVFESVVRYAHTYQDRGRPGVWLHVIARHALLDEVKSNARRGTAASLHEHQAVTVDAGSTRHLTKLQVSQALQQLTERQRMVMVEQFWAGAPAEDTALLMGITVDGVKKLRMAACRNLRRLLAA